MKMNDVAKSMILSIVITTLFFLALEVTQRVRWYVKSEGSAYWLLYGFVPRPADYDRQVYRLSEKKKRPKDSLPKHVYEIQVWEKKFANGIKKHNPEAIEFKGQINSLGFRSPEFEPKKPRDIYRIIAVGGSTTAGYESALDQTYTAFLQKRLNDGIRGNKYFEVINAGKGEQAMPYVNELLEKELIQYEPDMAILYMAFNELASAKLKVNIPRDFYYWTCRFKNWLSGKSLLFFTLREKLHILFHIGGYTVGDMYVPARSSTSLAAGFLNTPVFFNNYRKELELFIDLCNKNGIKPVLVTEACLLGNDSYLLLGAGMAGVYDKMYDIMEHVAMAKGAVFVDAARVFNKLQNKDKLFTDGLHLKPKGNEMLADIVYAELKPRL